MLSLTRTVSFYHGIFDFFVAFEANLVVSHFVLPGSIILTWYFFSTYKANFLFPIILTSVSFSGYRCFQAVMFLTGLIFGAAVVYLICQGQQFFEEEISFQMTIG